MLKNAEVYEDILENGALSKEKLYELMRDYTEHAQEVAKRIINNPELEESERADEFFNSIDGSHLLSFKAGHSTYDVTLGSFYAEEEGDEPATYGVCYMIEERDENDNLQMVYDFSSGEEETFIQKLNELGLQ